MVKALKAQPRMIAGLALAAVLSFAASSIPFRLAANDQAVDGTVDRRDRADPGHPVDRRRADNAGRAAFRHRPGRFASKISRST